VIVELAPPGLLRADAERAWHSFQDPTQSGVVVVTLPEELPVNETEELVQALRTDLKLPVAALVVNAVCEQLFAPEARRALGALAANMPGHELPGGPALAAGVRRALHEGVQSDCLTRLHGLGLTELELPLLIGGASSRQALAKLASRFARSWAPS
jgi:hypothetical protein